MTEPSNQKSFILHKDSLDILDELSVEDVGLLFLAIKAFHHGEEIELSPLVKIAFTPIRNQFKRDAEKYGAICKKRAEYGSKGGKQKASNVAKASISYQNVAKLADNDSKNDSVNDSVNDNDSDSKKENKNITNIPDYISKKTWADIKKHRTKIRKPMTERAEKVLLGKLEDIHAAGICIEAAVDMMVDKSWSSISVDWYNNEMKKRLASGSVDKIQRSGFSQNEYRAEI